MHRRFKSWLPTSKAQNHLDKNHLACTLDDNNCLQNNQRTPEGLNIHTKGPVLCSEYTYCTLCISRSAIFARFIFLSCAKEITRPMQTAVSNRLGYTASYADRNRVAGYLVSWDEIHEVRRHGGDGIKARPLPFLSYENSSSVALYLSLNLCSKLSFHYALRQWRRKAPMATQIRK